MKLSMRLMATAVLLAASASAIASDGFGIAKFAFGVALLLVVAVVLGFMLTRPPSKTIKMLSVLVFGPTICGFVVACQCLVPLF